ncbi:MAG: penicillin-binding protein 2 [Clostridia bacterium]|nr:penicillin-binding protein 2 [Clostridia bacterium]
MKRRTLKFYALLILTLTALLTRVYSVMSDESMAVLASGRRYSVKLTEIRGDIVDRNGASLLDGENDVYAVCVPPLKGGEYAIRRLAEAAGVSAERVAKNVESGMPFALKVGDADLRLENVALLEVPRRFPSDGVAAHIIGYVDGEGKGVCGIERAFDDVLTCDGVYNASVTVSARGRELTDAVISGGGSGGRSAVALTVDKNLSLMARAAFYSVEGNERGAVVVMDVKNGDLLACESFPDYDPNDVADSLNGANAPLLNRAFSAFNIGSAFKIVTAAAILEGGLGGTRYTCRGYIHVGGRDVACHNESGHGAEDLAAAFANSCNPYFINAALKLDADGLIGAAERLGIGRAYRLADGMVTDGGNLTEKSSLSVPAAKANFSIGQGDLMVTPVQAAVMVSAVANGGLRPTPRLVTAVIGEMGDKTEVFDSAEPVRALSEEVAAELRALMVNAVENGTGAAAKPKNGGAGGKTATAQTGSFSGGARVNNAWFVGFWPAENPQYAIVVLCENGSSGSRSAAPVFRMICDYLD